MSTFIEKEIRKSFLFFVLGICLSSKSIAQDYNRTYSMICQYEMEYQPDSTDVSLRKKATMGLLLNTDYSLFGEWNNLLIDTVMYKYYLTAPKNAGAPRGALRNSNNEIRYRIYKNAQNKIGTLDRVRLITSPTYQYEESKKVFTWKIQKDTATIAGYQCQRAECSYGNRHWIAWFTFQVPISDGPFKFCGLPGLIIKVGDITNSWKFTLTALEKRDFAYSFYNRSPSDKIKKVSKDEYFDNLRESYDNAYALDQANGIKFMNGKEDVKKEYEERVRKESNWIDLHRKTKAN